MSKNDKTATLEELRTQLSEYIAWFEGDDFSIEHALEKYKSAQDIASKIEAILERHEHDITIVRQSFDADAA